MHPEASLKRCLAAGLIAVLALVALAPLMGAWLRPAPDAQAPWLQVCSARSPLAGLGHGPGREAPALPAGDHGHCPWCHFAQDLLGPPPAGLAGMQPLPARAGAPERFLSAARTAHAWRTASPRGPPAPLA